MTEAAVSLEAKVAALRTGAAFPADAGAVEAIETHMSWVFLTREHAFKLKKPMRVDGVDCSTLAARRFLCIEELRLNRRLAPWVYLDVVPLRQDRDGAVRIDREGTVVDWLVMMRRLSADRLLDRLLAQGEARPEHLRQVALQLAQFYRCLPAALADPQAYRERLRRQVDECEAKLCDPDVALDGVPARPLGAQLRLFLAHRADLFAARVAAGRIVEGHGDLRPEHIWLGTPPAIIDCLEFSLELRTVDSADEVAFLALECERLAAGDLGRVLLAEYGRVTGDAPEPELVHFYQALRACVRAGISLWHLKETRYRSSPAWAARARWYLERAEQHLQRCTAPLACG